MVMVNIYIMVPYKSEEIQDILYKNIHHTIFGWPIIALGLNIVPGSINFDGKDARDVIMLEYNYEYRNLNG